MKRIITALLVATGTIFTANASNEELSILSSFPEGFVYNTDVTDPFVKLLEEESNGEFTFEKRYSDTVPPLEQLEPTQAGVFDLLVTHPAYHAGASKLGLALDGIRADSEKRRSSGVIDYLDEHYQSMGLKLIAAPPVGGSNGAFSIYLTKPIEGSPSLEGRKIRGTITYHPLLEDLGASGVVMGGGEVYSSLQKGVIDGAAFALGAPQLRWFEVANFVAQPRFGNVSLIILMNLDAWDALSDEQKSMIEAAAQKFEVEALGRFDAIYDSEMETLLNEGMITTDFPTEDAAKLDKLLGDGVWALAAEGDAAKTEAFRALADKAELTD